MSSLLAKSIITTWNIHQNNSVINLNIKFGNYGDSKVENQSYRKISHKQQQRNHKRAQDHKTNKEQNIVTRSKSRKSQEDSTNAAETPLADKESSRNIDTGVSYHDQQRAESIASHTPVTPITHTLSQQDIEQNVSLPVSEPIAVESVCPELPDPEPDFITEPELFTDFVGLLASGKQSGGSSDITCGDKYFIKTMSKNFCKSEKGLILTPHGTILPDHLQKLFRQIDELYDLYDDDDDIDDT